MTIRLSEQEALKLGIIKEPLRRSAPGPRPDFKVQDPVPAEPPTDKDWYRKYIAELEARHKRVDDAVNKKQIELARQAIQREDEQKSELRFWNKPIGDITWTDQWWFWSGVAVGWFMAHTLR